MLTLMGHTPWGMDFAPALAVKTGLPLVTDCVDILMDQARPEGIRQIYAGKLLSRVSMRESAGYLFTVRPGAFPSDKRRDYRAEVVRREVPADLPAPRKQFIEFVDTAAISRRLIAAAGLRLSASQRRWVKRRPIR